MIFLTQDPNRLNMVCMIMSNEYTPNIFKRQAMFFQLSFNGTHRHSGIYQETVTCCAYVVTIATTAATHT